MTDQDPTQPFEAPQPTPGVPAQPAPPAPGAAPASSQPVQPTPPPAIPTPYTPPPAYAPPAAPAAPSGPDAAPWAAASQPPAAPPPVWAPPAMDPFGAPPPPAAGVPPSGFDAPVVPVATKRKGGGPLRWIVAVLVVALVVAGGLGAALLLTSSTSGTSTVLGYVPADTLTYAEARLDLPGNQRAEVAKALSAFPGFADQAALNTKLAEVYDRIIKAATSGKHDYQTDIAPWFGGQLAVAQGPQDTLGGLAYLNASPAPSPTISPTASLPPCTGLDTATPAPSQSNDMGFAPGSLNIRYLGLLSVTDAKKAEAWIGSILSEAGTKTTDATCDGAVVHVIATPSSGFIATPTMGWAVLADKVLVAGDLDSVRLAIATKGAGGLSTTANFQKAVAALKGDHVGFVYEALRATYASQLGAVKAMDTDGTATAALNVAMTLIPEWIAADLKAADGNFVADTVQPALDISPTTNRTSDLAALAPPKTIALMDTHDVGKTLASIRAKFAAEPKLAQYVKQFDDALGLAGGFDSTMGWIGDAGFAITRDGSKISGGILIRPEDASAAKHLFTQIRSLGELSGATAGLTISDADYKGATLTTIDLSKLAPLLESSMGSSLGGMTIPSDLKLVYAATDKVVLMTLDTDFAKAVIDASQGGDSLAKDPRFAALLAKAGDKNTAIVYVDVTATREIIEGLLPTDARSKYDSDIRPYLLPIDALISTGVYDNGLSLGTAILSIKH